MKNIKTQKRVGNILRLLSKEYSDTSSELHYKTVFQLLVATILSAQCTDKRVNEVTKTLFKEYPSVKTFQQISQRKLEEKIRSTGFFRNKAKNIIKTAKILYEKHKGKVPRTMAGLLALPGVARKTGNIVLYHGFGVREGIAVDTHVKRLSQRLNLSRASEPVKIEKDLMEIIPQNKWGDINGLLVLHGRRVCNARNPKCSICTITRFCSYYKKEKGKNGKGL